jgi:hypothetical protein
VDVQLRSSVRANVDEADIQTIEAEGYIIQKKGTGKCCKDCEWLIDWLGGWVVAVGFELFE